MLGLLGVIYLFALFMGTFTAIVLLNVRVLKREVRQYSLGMATGLFVGLGRRTWGIPTDPKEREYVRERISEPAHPISDEDLDAFFRARFRVYWQFGLTLLILFAVGSGVASWLQSHGPIF